MAKGLGADVPFFLRCIPSLALGIGEILEPLENWHEIWYVVVKPALDISTAWAFEKLKLELTTGVDKYIKNILVKNRAALFQVLENDLEKVTSASYPIIETIKRRLLEAGAEGALMTGSGPSVFGVFPSSKSAISAKKDIISQDLGDVFLATHWERPRDSDIYLS
jgi:4-diphosphocytidyl-2-C-methyl-D-erythritol kinase